MKSVTAHDARMQFSDLLDRVARGEEIIITRYGAPVALLVPLHRRGSKPTHKEIVEGLRALRKRVKPGKTTLREMVAQGRKF